MDCALNYHFIVAEREAYQKLTHCQNVTNRSSITRHLWWKGLHWRVLVTNHRQYICLQTTQCEVPQPRLGQYHFTELSQFHYINHFETYML